MVLLGVVLVVAVLLYMLFRQTMNRLQYVQTIRLYWIARDNATGKRLARGFMKQTAPPFWQGRGFQIRVGTYSFQIGILKRKGESLLDQMGGREMDETAKEIREWG
jgi:Tfp pilus assembly protein PilV